MIWLILAIGLILRIINLNQSLWLDEASQVILSLDSIHSIFFNHGADFHPPLSYILMHFWIIFSKNEVWLRLLSVVFGVATLYFTYLISKKLFNKKTGFMSAFLLAISPFHIYYSQEVRMYSEASFFAVLSMYFFYLWLTLEKFKYSFGYIMATTALIYTHYDGFFLLISQLFFIAFYKKDKIKIFLLSLLSISLLWTPWIPRFLIQLRAGLNVNQYLPGWKDVLSVPFYKALPLIFLKFSIGRVDFENKNFYLVLAILVITVFGYVILQSLKRTGNSNFKLVLLWFLIPIILASFISLRLPINQPFRLLYILPAFYILLVLGLTSLGKYKQIMFGAIITISFSGVLLYYFNPKYQRENWREASSFVVQTSSENSLVLFAWPDQPPPYKWYGRYTTAVGVVPNFPARKQEVEDRLKVADQKKEIFLFEYLQALSDPNKYIQAILETKGFKQDRVYNFTGVGFVYHYAKS